MPEFMFYDLRQAVDDALAKGTRLDEFTKNFESTAAKHGWTGWTGEGSPAGRAWRARTIYETNLRTAYAAGRYKQMTDPDMVKARPYWQYKHGFTRRPKAPRSHHLALDGLILRCDDLAWNEIYPPNGWGCTCGVVPLSRRQMERLGRTEPDPSPNLPKRRVIDPATGETELVPQGISPGWNHAPGKDWAEGLIPKELQKPLADSRDTPDKGTPPPANLVPLRQIARPSKAEELPEGKSAEYYVDRILAAVGARRGPDGAKLIRDKAGQVVAVSDAMFKDGAGHWKVFKAGRAGNLLKAFEALTDPDEIWVDWERRRDTGEMQLKRRYVRFDPDLAVFSAFSWGKDGWGGSTLFPTRGSSGKRERYIEGQRHGALLYRRK
ncbi:PBECR2 nuclease fold domain-containing protein [Candidatus Tokpelaia sp.]|uniref:PBECR2 nuclease fold domain-containing protein n=1 Tax=Candidatus Tokpelaia sp. TaxID=2233777 RepID=UPI00123B306A|nr:PBECR2 nuclease fold domain-containing protein [Candidatus Tokpelaia sp.]